MHVQHEAILADIKRRVRTPGATLAEVDAAIAAELDVSAQTYYAYLLVWGAIEVYRQQRLPPDPCRPAADAVPAADLQRCQSTTAHLGWHGAIIYQQPADQGSPAADIVDHAAEILGAVLDLRHDLRALQTPVSGPADGDGGQAVRS